MNLTSLSWLLRFIFLGPWGCCGVWGGMVWPPCPVQTDWPAREQQRGGRREDRQGRHSSQESGVRVGCTEWKTPVTEPCEHQGLTCLSPKVVLRLVRKLHGAIGLHAFPASEHKACIPKTVSWPMVAGGAPAITGSAEAGPYLSLSHVL